jgi:hypothetical protein
MQLRAGDPGAEQARQWLSSSRAFAIVKEREPAKAAGLERVVAQPTNALSRATRTELAGIFAPGVPHVPEEQAAALLGLLDRTKEPLQTLRLAQQLAFVTPIERPFTLHAGVAAMRAPPAMPKDIEAYRAKILRLLDPTPSPEPRPQVTKDDFVDQPLEPSARFDVDIRGRTIPVFAPLVAGAIPNPRDHFSGVDGLDNHSVAEVAAALAKLPDEVLSLIRRVHLFTTRSPSDAVWGPIQHRPPGTPDELRGYMEALAYPEGDVGIFPQPKGRTGDAGAMHATLGHEAWHLVGSALRGRDASGSGWRNWDAALMADGVRVSGYAWTSLLESDAEAGLALGIYKLSTWADPDRRLIDELAAMFPAQQAEVDKAIAQLRRRMRNAEAP